VVVVLALLREDCNPVTFCVVVELALLREDCNPVTFSVVVELALLREDCNPVTFSVVVVLALLRWRTSRLFRRTTVNVNPQAFCHALCSFIY
jgi:hypothetical protein